MILLKRLACHGMQYDSDTSLMATPETYTLVVCVKCFHNTTLPYGHPFKPSMYNIRTYCMYVACEVQWVGVKRVLNCLCCCM